MHDLKHVTLEVIVFRVDSHLVTRVVSALLLKKVDPACVVAVFVIERTDVDPSNRTELPRAFGMHREARSQSLGVYLTSCVESLIATLSVLHLYEGWLPPRVE